jgi:hypothetical protein
MTSSALGFLLAGWLSESLSPQAAVSICATLSLGGIAALAATWPKRSLTNAVDRAFNGSVAQH